MRAVNLADLEIAARVLLNIPQQDRSACMAELLARADLADRHRKKLRRPHARFGTGTLMSAAQGYGMAARPMRVSHDELHAFATVITGLIARSDHQNS